jgi:hypothetical protein
MAPLVAVPIVVAQRVLTVDRVDIKRLDLARQLHVSAGQGARAAEIVGLARMSDKIGHASGKGEFDARSQGWGGVQ